MRLITIHDWCVDLQQLKYVVAVAELGNFTRAAERCFVVQSALSHQIAKLEQELGARLFHRTSRSVALTFVDFPAGTTGRVQADRAFLAAELERKDAFEITDPQVMARLVTEGLGVALLATTYAVRIPGVTVVPVVNTSYRVEHLIWSRLGPTPAADAFIARATQPSTTSAL